MAAPSSATINWDNVNSLTERRMLPKLTDQIFRSNALMQRLWSKGTKLDGGAFITQMLAYGEGPGGAFEGLEILDTSEAEQFTTAVFSWKHYYAAITIRRMDELKNRGGAAFARLLTAKMQVAEKTMQNLVGQGIYSDGTTNAKLITGLRAAVTDATDAVTYGGINKATATNSWWQSKIDRTTTVLSVPAMRTLAGLCTEDNETPDLVVTYQAQYDNYYNELQPAQRFADSDLARGGFKNILFEGRPVVVDSHCPTGLMYFLNTTYLDLVSHEDENMRFEPFRQPYNQAGRTAFIFWAGNLTCSNCRYQGVMNALT